MSEASLAAQRLAVITMRQSIALGALVPDANIFDRNSRPEVFPCVIVGEGQTVGDDIDCADLSEVFLQIHAWTKENGMVAVKEIAGEIRRALRRKEGVQDGFDLSFDFEDTVFLRDPSGEHSHAVISFSVHAEDTVGVF
ncbi:DUF3168 domain-containing protein [Mesorhizobium sp. AA22]|uniref:DUF3168 domain-containing protein n=1 Tax=Mesorhizobium sp. AA22 TaxID=1854057 RepID=UPI0007EC5461|nr:DUF3168 domain-containing protein [Mesorhizobium sp. AA22]QIA23095.1 DUF3168 domain-containing protein [Mesorhizobium sp. AA22]